MRKFSQSTSLHYIEKGILFMSISKVYLASNLYYVFGIERQDCARQKEIENVVSITMIAVDRILV